jgi:GT2 family glycosyltransferase
MDDLRSRPVRVSFLIPLYNCLPLTQAMLASLQETVPATLDHEILLIDDGSTDGTREWLQTLNAPYLRVLLNDRNLGYASTNNRAAAAATGDVLVLLNNDLLLTPHWLEPMLAAHAGLGARAGIIGNIQRAVSTGLIDHAGIIINSKGKPVHDRELPPFAPKVKPVPAVTGACMLVARALWHQLGGFDTAFINGGEDIDLCFRAHQLGRVVAVAQRSIIFHHISSSPGRKLRDEHNSQLLSTRWRSRLTCLTHRAWSIDRLAHLDGATAASAPIESLHVVLHAAGLLSRPPIPTQRGTADAFDIENERWQNLLT